jgi:hypothetical protein
MKSVLANQTQVMGQRRFLRRPAMLVLNGTEMEPNVGQMTPRHQ